MMGDPTTKETIKRRITKSTNAKRPLLIGGRVEVTYRETKQPRAHHPKPKMQFQARMLWNGDGFDTYRRELDKDLFETTEKLAQHEGRPIGYPCFVISAREGATYLHHFIYPMAAAMILEVPHLLGERALLQDATVFADWEQRLVTDTKRVYPNAVLHSVGEPREYPCWGFVHVMLPNVGTGIVTDQDAFHVVFNYAFVYRDELIQLGMPVHDDAPETNRRRMLE